MTVVSSSIDELLAHRNGSVRSNWSAARLAEAALQRNEGTLADNGALVVKTGAFTGRSPQDKYVVRDATTESDVWWGSVNHPVSPAVFDQLLSKALAHLAQRELYVFDGYAGAAQSERLGLRVITEKAWHALFATTLFIRPSNGELADEEETYVPAKGKRQTAAAE